VEKSSTQISVIFETLSKVNSPNLVTLAGVVATEARSTNDHSKSYEALQFPTQIFFYEKMVKSANPTKLKLTYLSKPNWQNWPSRLVRFDRACSNSKNACLKKVFLDLAISSCDPFVARVDEQQIQNLKISKNLGKILIKALIVIIRNSNLQSQTWMNVLVSRKM
jgi:hypothetical protein